MKKKLALLVTLAILLGLTGCRFGYRENSWFSQDYLQACLVAELPSPSGRDFVVRNDTACFFMNSGEFDNYLQTVYAYLQQQNYLYFGTRGDTFNTLAGVLTTYYFQEAVELSDFYVDGCYRFVFSDGSVDEDGEEIFYVLTVTQGQTQTIRIGRKDFSYNVKLCLCQHPESSLGGWYRLP